MRPSWGGVEFWGQLRSEFATHWPIAGQSRPNFGPGFRPLASASPRSTSHGNLPEPTYHGFPRLRHWLVRGPLGCARRSSMRGATATSATAPAATPAARPRCSPTPSPRTASKGAARANGAAWPRPARTATSRCRRRGDPRFQVPRSVYCAPSPPFSATFRTGNSGTCRGGGGARCSDKRRFQEPLSGRSHSPERCCTMQPVLLRASTC